MKNKILIIITFLAGTLLFNSCLKDKVTSDWTSSLQGKMYAEIVKGGLVSDATYAAQSFTINNGSADQAISFFVNIATDQLPTADITVNFSVDAAALTAYNTSHGTNLVVCPTATIAPLVIKAGTRNGYAQITLKTANLLDLAKAYAIPISIASVSNTSVIIASNFKSEILQIPIANKWEGSYKMNYYALRAGDNVLSGSFRNLAWKLSTSGAKSVVYYKTHLWGDGKTVIGGIGPWNITIDDSVTPNKISITDAANAAVVLDPAYNNRYDPATKTFYISAYWGTGPTNRAATDTLVYTGKY
jgi:hypothetical protein